MAKNTFNDENDMDDNDRPVRRDRTNRQIVWLVAAGVLLLLVIAGVLGWKEYREQKEIKAKRGDDVERFDKPENEFR